MSTQNDSNIKQKLDKGSRVSIMVSPTDKGEFDKLKNGLYDWQLFKKMLSVYKQYAHLAEREAA